MKNLLLGLFLTLSIVMIGCSESEVTNTDERTVTIEDGMGEQIIEGTPENVVVLEWSYVEHLLPLDVEPLGVADVEGYNHWVNVGDPLRESTEDIGTRSEPSLEAIASLEPDLIIGAKYRHEGIIEELEEIAPTVMFSPYSEEGAEDQYEHLLNEFDSMAAIFDKQEEADEMKEKLDTTYKEQAERLESAGFDNIEAVVTQAFSSQNTPTMRHFTDNSVVAGVLEELGIQNAVKTEEPEIYGFIETTVETLQNYQNVHFFYLVQEDDNIFDDQLADNPAWTNLEFVEENRTYKLPGDMGTFAGPLSAERLAIELTDSLIDSK
ncbi:ABC transporter substrate-binding protein [Halobacillus sp. A5]|uniref:ABC transporter substrate-binding protein n=1 Tax=Halobacillus sp. A5 TaxID=2880263 RepID=UPI0020A67BAC|nr:iron-siderophore ABC transporter substrate-binding protein [Halobacillus sp. A5]MCP3027997.1 iron-siderophore ABC transporter substrate-binding protein [Halobacillus sp. A5]